VDAARRKFLGAMPLSTTIGDTHMKA